MSINFRYFKYQILRELKLKAINSYKRYLYTEMINLHFLLKKRR